MSSKKQATINFSPEIALLKCVSFVFNSADQSDESTAMQKLNARMSQVKAFMKAKLPDAKLR